MGAKKKNTGGENKENEDNITTVILKVDMHCDGCASKMVKYLRDFQGVKRVKAESEAGKLTVTGKVDPTEVRDSLAKKFNKKVELVSPQPKKEKEKENNDNKTNNQSKNKTHSKKTKDKEEVTTAVLKMDLHCQGCLDKIDKIVLKTKGVQGMGVDKEKETITVKGTMDVEALVGKLMEKLKKKAVVVPSKKDKDNENNKDENEGGNKKKKNKGANKNENEEGIVERMEQNRMEYLVPPVGFGYGYGNINGGYNYVPVYPEQMHFHLHAPPPQMFSDENPNACSIM